MLHAREVTIAIGERGRIRVEQEPEVGRGIRLPLVHHGGDVPRLVAIYLVDQLQIVRKRDVALYHRHVVVAARVWCPGGNAVGRVSRRRGEIGIAAHHLVHHHRVGEVGCRIGPNEPHVEYGVLHDGAGRECRHVEFHQDRVRDTVVRPGICRQQRVAAVVGCVDIDRGVLRRKPDDGAGSDDVLVNAGNRRERGNRDDRDGDNWTSSGTHSGPPQRGGPPRFPNAQNTPIPESPADRSVSIRLRLRLNSVRALSGKRGSLRSKLTWQQQARCPA